MALALNRVMLMGRLVKDPEVKATAAGDSIAKFTLKISEPKDNGDGHSETYQRIVVFGKAAEAVGNFLKEGSPLYVDGRIHANSWEGEDGKKRSMTEVIASEIQFFPKEYDEHAVVGLNKVLLMGNTAADASFGQSQSGTAYNSFTVAIDGNRGQSGQTEWVKAVAFGEAAIDTSDLAKGTPVFIEGRLRTRSYEKEGGTKEYLTEVVAHETTRLTFPAHQMDHDSAPGR